jgi:hypothetical protein
MCRARRCQVLIAELESSSPDQEFYDAKVKVLSEQIEHHVHEEKRSDGIFAQARAAGLDIHAVGARILARKRELTAQFDADGLPSPEARTFTGHDLEMGEPVDEAHVKP